MLDLHRALWRFNLPALLAIITIGVFSLLRVLLTFISWPQLSHDAAEIASLVLRGLLFDAVVALYVYGFFSLCGLLISERWRQSVWGHKATLLIAWSYLFALAFVMAAEWFFWQEFNVRFNFIAVDYLIYRREVTGNISQSYPVEIILPILALLVMGMVYLLRKPLQISINHRLTLKSRLYTAFIILLMLIGVGQLRGNDVPQLSNNMYVEELAQTAYFSSFMRLDTMT